MRLGWALFIRFLQDVVRFGAGAMVLAGRVEVSNFLATYSDLNDSTGFVLATT
jgi:hypothetical protein